MNKDTTTSIRGIMAIMIVLSHLGEYYHRVGSFFTPWGGYIGVSAFYFFSGYNLAYCKKNKKNYIDGFLEKKLIRVFLPGYIMYILYMFVINRGFDIATIYKCGYLNNDCFFYWYVKSIVYIYLIFFIVYKLFEKYNIENNTLFGIIVWIITIIMNSFFVPTWLDYIVPVGFIFGWMMAIYGKKIEKYLNNSVMILLESCALIVLITVACLSELSVFVVLFRFLACIIIALLCFSISTRFIFSCIFKKIGMISYEIYLVHPVLIRLCEAMSVGKVIYVLVVCIGTIFLAYILLKMTLHVMNKCILDKKKD